MERQLKPVREFVGGAAIDFGFARARVDHFCKPVAFEHARILASKALGHSQSVLIASHNTPFGDIVDSEDDLQPLVFAMTAEALRALRLFAGVAANCEVNTARMAERANSDFLSVTELADTLVRMEGLPFREAHHLVSAAVHDLHGHYSPEAMVDAVLRTNALRTPRAVLLKALDPINFVEIRRIPGGPATEPIRAAIHEAESQIAHTAEWLASKTAMLAACPQRIEKERHSLLAKLR